eukprot:5862281-Pleurochrysis_carterae.AAC.1
MRSSIRLDKTPPLPSAPSITALLPTFRSSMLTVRSHVLSTCFQQRPPPPFSVLLACMRFFVIFLFVCMLRVCVAGTLGMPKPEWLNQSYYDAKIAPFAVPAESLLRQAAA